MDKVYSDARSALAGLVKDGMTIMAGGFGLCGIPEALIEASVIRGQGPDLHLQQCGRGRRRPRPAAGNPADPQDDLVLCGREQALRPAIPLRRAGAGVQPAGDTRRAHPRRRTGRARSSGRRGTGRWASGTGSCSTPDLYETARLAALDSLQRHPDHVHEDELWIAFTERIVQGMGGDGDGGARLRRRARAGLGAARALHALRGRAARARRAARHGVKIGLISNGSRDLDEFVAHHAPRRRLRRRLTGVRPHQAAPGDLPARAGAARRRPGEAAMIGDSYEDDIEGARALGMRAFLLDRDGRRPDEPDRLPDRFALPAALGPSSG